MKYISFNIKLQRLCKSHHLQCITSSKYSEKLEKSLCARDKTEDRCCLWDLRRYCIPHWHDSVIDIAKWAQEYFQKPLLVKTIRRAICRRQLKLYHAKRKPYVNMVQKRHHVLWAKAHLKWTVSKWKSILWSDESKFDILVGNHGWRVFQAKEEGDLPARATYSPLYNVYFREWLVYFSRTMQNHILQLLQQHGFVVEKSRCWIDLLAVQIFHLENIWHIIKLKIQPQTLQQLETYIRQEWDQIPTPKLQKLITSMPRHFKTVLKRTGDATPW